MESEEIRTLLASIPPPVDLAIPVPPNMRAIPTAAVVEAGGDPELIEKWVRAVKGWPKRIPPMFAAPDATELELTFFIVPDRELESARRAPAVSLADADLIAFVPTKDMAKARPFYERTLGLKLEGSSPVACAFRANGVLLRLIAVEQLTPYPFTVLGWSVKDIATTVAGLTANGVVFERFEGVEQDDLGVWLSPGGARVAWFKDPDANTLSLTQF
jgi:catechol 2,3-dioxygenase-like lactoylglutathione lyase family enzyme